MSTQGGSWAELMSILRWMEQEGLVELYYDDKGRECVRITPEGESFEFAS